MQVTCKFCQRPQEYAPGDPAPKRHRKVCESCGQRFTVPKEQVGAQGKAQLARSPGDKWAAKLHSKDPRLGHLDAMDNALLEQLGQGESQPSAARAIGITRQAAWWRIKNLVKIGILQEHLTYPRSYSLLPQLKDGAEYVILNHDVHIRMDIRAAGEKFEDWRDTVKGTWMGNWWHHYFDHNHVHFEVNETKTPNVCFHMTGAGRTAADIENNALSKALEARDWLEDHLGVMLGDPAINRNQQDDVIIYLNEEQYQAKCRVWNDRSDKDALLEGKLGNTNAEKAVQILNNQGEMRAEMDAIKADHAAIRAEIAGVKSTPGADTAADIQAALHGYEARMDTLDKRLDSIDSRFLRIEGILNRFADTFERIAG